MFSRASRTASQSFGCMTTAVGRALPVTRTLVRALKMASITLSAPSAWMFTPAVFRMPVKFSPVPSPFRICVSSASVRPSSRRLLMMPRICGASASVLLVTGIQWASVRTGEVCELNASTDSGLVPVVPVVAVASATIAALLVNVSSRTYSIMSESVWIRGIRSSTLISRCRIVSAPGCTSLATIEPAEPVPE